MALTAFSRLSLNDLSPRSVNKVARSEVWVYPDSLPRGPQCLGWPSNCASNSSSTNSSTSSGRDCSDSKCTRSFLGSCFAYDTLVDKRCICSGWTTANCHPCQTATAKAVYHGWMNRMCGDVEGWKGLPTDWTSQVHLGPLHRFGSWTGQYCSHPSSSLCWVASADIPSLSGTISFQHMETFTENLYDAAELNAADPVGASNGTYDQLTAYLAADDFCEQIYYPEHQPGVPLDGSKTFVLLWAAKICYTPSLRAFPDNWRESLAFTDQKGYINSTSLPPAPSCLNQTQCSTQLVNQQRESTGTRCKYNATSGSCDYISSMVEVVGFCKPLDFKLPCAQGCELYWERKAYLEWLNSTCGDVTDWKGLPKNWESLLLVQEFELLPPAWRLSQPKSPLMAPNITSESHHCPSASSKLGAFAAVNIAMALLMPIVGRRDFINKITRGYCGAPGSNLWLATGPAAAVLHVISNAIGAAIIKATPGYHSVDVGEITLLWCTRPRVTWMIICFVPFQAKDAIYFSVATSALFAEVLLQVLGAYYMVTATNYARRQKFYENEALTRANTPLGRNALVMYLGSILWLSAIVFAVSACIWSIIGISTQVKAFVVQVIASRAKRQRSMARSLQASLSQAKQKHLRDHEEINSEREVEISGFKPFTNELLELYSSTQANLMNLELHWDVFYRYATTDFQSWSNAKSDLRRQERLLQNAPQKTGFLNSMSVFFGPMLNKSPSTIPDTLTSAEAQVSYNYVLSDYNDALEHWNSQPSRELILVQASKIFWPQKQPGIRLYTALESQIGQSIRVSGERATFRPGNERAIVRNCKYYLRKVAQRVRELEATHKHVERGHGMLCAFWEAQNREREKEADEAKDTIVLEKIALRTILGMIGCFIAQWLWWGGYVKVAGNQYCPPNLVKITAIWIIFSLFGVMLGASG